MAPTIQTEYSPS